MVSSGAPILGRLSGVTYAALVRSRRMTRRFAPLPQVSESVVADLIDLASCAPSAGNAQGSDYVVLRDPGDRGRFWSAARPTPGTHRHAPGDRGEMAHAGPAGASASPWLAGVSAAPTLIVCVGDQDAYRRRYAEGDKGGIRPEEQDWPVPYWLTDVAMGAMILLLGARDAGLGALFFGVPGQRHIAVREALGIPMSRQLVGVIALGHEAERVRSSSLDRPRRRGPEVTHWGRFGVARHPLSQVSETMPGESTP